MRNDKCYRKIYENYNGENNMVTSIQQKQIYYLNDDTTLLATASIHNAFVQFNENKVKTTKKQTYSKLHKMINGT